MLFFWDLACEEEEATRWASSDIGKDSVGGGMSCGSMLICLTEEGIEEHVVLLAGD